VIWGGRVVGIVNAGQFTELEVLALPLRGGDRPDRNADGSARFVIRHAGFLEPMTFSPGRYVTVLGRFVDIESRAVGAFELRHPVVQSEQLELWPVDPNSNRPDLHFGIGVRL
jgi:outer membrane lipoprotein